MKLNKRVITTGILILAICVVGKLLFGALKNFKPDEFHPAAIIMLVDSSASNVKELPEQIKYIRQLCAILDPEDEIKILKVSESSYLIYEGSPSDTKSISKSFEAFTKYNANEYGTAYGEAMKKAFTHALAMKKDGYTPAVVVIGDLENEGAREKQIDWETFPESVRNLQNEIPEFSMAFLFAHPEKLDFVKTELSPILGEKKLILANNKVTDKASRKILEAIGR